MASYTINVADSKLEELKTKLSVATFPDELSGAAWDYGAPLADVKRLTAYWKDGFDWRAQETMLNQLPQFHRGIKVDKIGRAHV